MIQYFHLSAATRHRGTKDFLLATAMTPREIVHELDQHHRSR